jgi:hypothetical protein
MKVANTLLNMTFCEYVSWRQRLIGYMNFLEASVAFRQTILVEDTKRINSVHEILTYKLEHSICQVNTLIVGKRSCDAIGYRA